MITYGRITDRLADPITPIASNGEEIINKSEQGDDMLPGSVIPASQPGICITEYKRIALNAI